MKIKNLIKTIFFVVIFFVLLNFFTGLFTYNDVYDQYRIAGFYQEPKDSLDVVLVGSSLAFTDYIAPLAYRDFGFTSYSLSMNGLPTADITAMLPEILKNQSPKLLVIEISSAINDTSISEASLRRWVDNMEHTGNWVNAINENADRDERINYFLSIAKYHENWKRIEKCLNSYKIIQDIKRNGQLYLKGNYGKQALNQDGFSDYLDVSSDTSSKAIGNIARSDLIKLLEYCRSKGIKNVLFTCFPRAISVDNYEDYCKLNAVGEIVESYGQQFINFCSYSNEIGLDPIKDYYNARHMNINGAVKFTKYLSKLILSNYDIKSNHSEQITKRWNESVDFTEKWIKYGQYLIASGQSTWLYEQSDLWPESVCTLATVYDKPVSAGGSNLLKENDRTVNLHAADSSYNSQKIYSAFKPGRKYAFSVGNIDTKNASSPFVSVCLYDFGSERLIQNACFLSDADGTQVWTFTVPKDCDNVSLIIYPSLRGKCSGVEATYYGLGLEISP